MFTKGIFNLSIIVLAMVFGSSPVSGQTVETEKTGTLTVLLTGFTSNKGVIRIALFKNQQSFSDGKYGINGAVRFDTLPIKGKKGTWIVENLPFGTYAVRTFHDLDKSGKFKVNRIGMPKYDYGFSNDAKALFGPPSYDKAKFSFQSSSKTIKITLHR